MFKKYLLPTSIFAISFIMLAFASSSSGGKKQIYDLNDTIAPLAVKAVDHKGLNVISKNGAVNFLSGLNNDCYQIDSANRTGFLYLETRLDKYINERATRIPLNLSIVIDRSGSMSGDKMAYAKKAAQDIINKLTADDYVSVVVYDDNVDLIQSSVRVLDKAAINKKIDGVFSRGSTNLWGGTERGYEQVKANYKDKFVNRVLLISDGLVNTGLTSSTEIKKRVQDYKDKDGITLSSFGVGLDYNEILMTDMAEAGSGNYYFIESPAMMAALFDKELNGMMNVVAQNAELKIKLPRGVGIQKIFSYKFDQRGDEVTIKFRDLFSEETKGVLIKFSIDDYANVPLKFISTLNYTDVGDQQAKSLTNENVLNACEGESYYSYYNELVLQQTILFQANENMEKAMVEADKGNYDEARKLITTNATYLKSNGSYVAKSMELTVMDSVNAKYSVDLKDAENMRGDDKQRMQKASRSKSYEIRNKKNK